ncbi:MAG: YeeE/YedE family protein [Victivallales bacterium]|nr:YeeE/YedE family protein [Victivallales bacterium]MCF7889030.1 YeeE/YedE family protein [Victivallales bacterium]
MWKKISGSTWSPWFTGIIIAFLFVISLYLLDAPLGTVNSYSKLLDKGIEACNGQMPVFTWDIFFLIGVLAGAFVAALAGKDFKLQLFPEDHLSKGPAFYLTLGPVYSFIGGLFVMGGLVIAGDTFIKLWTDWMALYMITGLFLIIMFIEAVVVGTMMTIRIEDKKDKR